MTTFTGHANQWYAEVLATLRDAPRVTSRGRDTRELLHVTTTLPDVRRRVLTVPWRRTNPWFQIAEPVWLLHGADEAEWILRYNRRLAAYLDEGRATFHGAYGARLRHWYGRDQLHDVLQQLLDDHGSRRACVILRDPLRDNPDTPTVDQPCNLAATYLVRDGRLHAEQEVVADVVALREALSWYDTWPDLVVVLTPGLEPDLANECATAAAEHGARVDRPWA